MQTFLIGVPCVEATPEPTGKAAALAQAADAFIANGLPEAIAALGVEVAGRSRPVLPSERISGDPICNLGRYNALVAAAVSGAIAGGAKPVLAGGTCSHLIGMLAGLQIAYGPTERIGLIWLDAHGDFNTPHTSHSGMLGGMPVAVSAGLCHPHWREKAGMTGPIPTNRIVMVDVRNLDKEEAELIAATDVAVAKYGPNGTGDGVATAIQRLADRVDHLSLHVDADVLDASLQPNHPTVEPNGPDLKTVLATLRVAFATGKVRAFGVVSVNPTGPEGRISMESGTRMLLGGIADWAEFSS
ncbi:MAG: arginase family protein [Thermomicrobiales bacterium]|nr:arginase family protein [Thermomicrobiales bacterium]